MQNSTSILSYSQNFEDVMLWRALQHVHDGTYVDIGAQDPVIDSVSKSFYLRGWRGVNVDPNVVYADALRSDRPEDLVIQAAVGTSQDPITFFRIPGTGLSTGIFSIAEEHRLIGYEVDVTTVRVVTLASILRSLMIDDVHWLKIDVEGMEADVLDSWGECEVRPWVLVIEATHPNSQRQTELAWIQKVIGRGYHEVHFDGLSRYFVSDHHPELDAAFATPPNIFDGFQVASHHFSVREICRENENEIRRLQATAAQASDARVSAENASADLLNKFHQADARRLILEGQVQKLTVDRERTAAILDERTSALTSNVDLLKAELSLANEKCDHMKDLLHEEREAALNNRGTALWAIATLISRVESGDRNVAEWTCREEAARKQISELTEQHLLSIAQYERRQTDLRGQLERADKKLSACTSALERERIEREGQNASAKWELENLRDEREELLIELDNTRINAQNVKAEYEAVVGVLLRRRNMGFAGYVRRAASKLGLCDQSLCERDISPRSLSHPWDKVQMKHHQEATSEKSLVVVERILPAPNLPSLLILSGQSFIRCAYVTLLGRYPDPDGEEYYISRLELGWTKASIINQLRSSREGRGYKARIDGLNKMISRYRRSHLPVVGWLFHKIHNEEGDSALELAMRRVDNSVAEISRRMDELICSHSIIDGRLQDNSVVLERYHQTAINAQIAANSQKESRLTVEEILEISN